WSLTPKPNVQVFSTTAANDTLGPSSQRGVELNSNFDPNGLVAPNHAPYAPFDTANPPSTSFANYLASLLSSGFPAPIPAGGTEPTKGVLVTQSLQGLMNSEVERPQPDNGVVQFQRFSNAPYHWRGDKKTFVDFNEAFVNLQGAKDVGTTEPMGVSASDMQ